MCEYFSDPGLFQDLERIESMQELERGKDAKNYLTKKITGTSNRKNKAERKTSTSSTLTQKFEKKINKLE